MKLEQRRDPRTTSLELSISITKQDKDIVRIISWLILIGKPPCLLRINFSLILYLSIRRGESYCSSKYNDSYEKEEKISLCSVFGNDFHRALGSR